MDASISIAVRRANSLLRIDPQNTRAATTLVSLLRQQGKWPELFQMAKRYAAFDDLPHEALASSPVDHAADFSYMNL